MSEKTEPLKINILKNQYSVNCPPEQRKDLITAADYLNTQMQKIKTEGKIIEFDKIAVMAALNISFDLLQFTQQGEEKNITHHHGQMKKLNNKVDEALNQLLQLEI